jgi:transposase
MPHGTVDQSRNAPSTLFIGLDVHKESVTLAVLPADAPARARVDKLPYDLTKLRGYLEKPGPTDTLRTCYEASGAGYVLQRELATWGIACTVIAPSLSPTKPGVQRKHDKYDASQRA